MSLVEEVPETRVLAIASHVVYGYVGNTMATFVMQSLGCEVSAINTVHYSNHTAYTQWKGRKTPPEEILELYEGLKQSYLSEFDVMLSGYMPSAEDIQAIGKIGRDLKQQALTKPGSFFWILDPVMGDDGKLYIPEDEVPQYKAVLRDADLILPNQFEAELLSDTKITDLESLSTAIKVLHHTYQIPHIIITSLRLSSTNETLPNPYTPSGSITPKSSTGSGSESPIEPEETMTIVGSTATRDHSPRLFRIDIPAYPIFFSGTGDMFAALTVPRLREAVAAAGVHQTARWISPDDVPATELPLAKACQKVLASMQAVLRKTHEFAKKEMHRISERDMLVGLVEGEEKEQIVRMQRYLAKTKATEVRVVRNVRDLIQPPELERYKAIEIEVKNS